MGQKWGPSLTLVGGLVAVAVVLVLMLWAALQFGGSDTTTTTTVLPAEQPDDEAAAPIDEAVEAEATPAVEVESEPVSEPEPLIDPSDAIIISAVTFDPEGDGEENDDLVERVIDGDSSTSWRTSCYSNEYMGAKDGVGIVVSFDTPVARPLEVGIEYAPYIVKFFGAIGDDAPATFDDWGAEVDSTFGSQGTTVTSARPPQPVSHMLVLIQQLGPSDGCTDTNPFRGSISEITLAN